ncbi:MAG TPA: hypothetical protein VHY08_13080 [Bacillota bacterium]|nr:hypothetical protein [Bacillota bacterium]
MKKIYAVIIAICLTLLISTAAFAHGQPEVWVDLMGGGGGSQTINSIVTDGANTFGYSIGGMYLWDYKIIKGKVWIEYSDQPELGVNSLEVRVGSPLVHLESLHVHTYCGYLKVTDNNTDISALMAGLNIVVALSDKSDVESYFGYSWGFNPDATNGNTSFAGPALFSGKTKFAFYLTDNLELTAGYRYINYDATNLSGSDGAFTVGVQYLFK